LVLPEPEAPLPAVELSLEPEEPLEDDGDGELEPGAPELEPPLSLFIARLPVEEPDEPDGLVEFGDDEAMPDEPDAPDEPDCERRESLPRSQAESPRAAASAAANAVRKSFFCSMSTIS
jgi:hypothetical protein